MNKKLSFASIIAVLLVISIILVIRKFETVDLTSEVAGEIYAALEQGQTALAVGALNWDCGQYSDIFVDTTDHRLTADTKAYIDQVLGSGASTHAGYYTAMYATCIHGSRIIPLYEALISQARAENRDLTGEEWDELKKANFGEIPPAPPPEGATVPEIVLDIQSIRVTLGGKKAVVLFDDGSALLKAILVRIDGRWWIASVVAQKVHF
ncbi:MAG: hypothetical protein EHM70_00345 [Chloroflexota bacterium]|nr:MAG: hypothetical protein EHM70_00345 [Chloroflexota bacterium]